MNLPNRLTLLRLVLCAVLLVFMELDWEWAGFIALIIFLLASLTDWLDGYLARSMGLVTNLGKLLDPLADKILISLVFIGFVSHELIAAWIVVCIISREFLITGLRGLAAAQGVIMAAEKAGKHKTISQVVTAVIGLAILAALQLNWQKEATLWIRQFVFEPMVWITLFITVYSGVAYFLRNHRIVVE